MADYEEMRAKLGRKLVDQYEEAEGFLREGSETEKAVDLLESALKETSESFPESIKASASYAELLLSYGKALLQTLREQETEDALLGPEVLKSIEAKDAAEEANDKEAEASKADGEGEDKLEDEEAGEEEAESEEADGDGEEGEGAEDAQDGDAQVSFELAWEQLENARVIFDSLSERKDHRLADVLETLGDFSMENDNFELAAKDYQAAIDVRLKVCADLVQPVGWQARVLRRQAWCGCAPDRKPRIKSYRRPSS
uniref:Tetratricopeptide SHNi-TPR domain-containing protein n=1 Tax=Rhodosorus marinus TaxID=101924 RepID=A0A7S2ZZW3_9RHOD|mmetsp:Transcript_35598/g.142112  ORF Transcript_35598/g.142112 Transcript_35598/m.142112 type:complete len:256 (+) Transcript_35598:175-942(+)